MEQNNTCYIKSLTIICIVLFIQVAVVVCFNQERGTSLSSEKTTNNVKGFNFLCSSKDDLDYFLVRSPRNDTYGPVKRGSTSSCANTTYSICLEIVDSECIVHFKTMNKTYVGEWTCITRLLDRNDQNSDAVIIMNRNNPFQELIFDTFEIGTFLIDSNLKTPDHVFWYLFLTLITFTATIIIFITLRLSIVHTCVKMERSC